MAESKRLAIIIDTNADKAAKSLNEASGGALKLQDSAAKATLAVKDHAAAQKELAKTASAQNQVFKTASVQFAGLAAAATLAGKAAIDFNAGWQKVATLGVANGRLDELKENIQSIAPAVAQSTAELTKSTYSYISAFGDTADTVKGVTIAAKAATVGLASVDEALQISSAVTKAWGDTSAAAQTKALDLANEVLRLGQTSFSDYANSIQRVTSLSFNLGVSQEELAAVFSSSTGVIGGAAEVSTQLRALFTELIKPTDTLKAALQGLGYETGEELIAARGLGGALQALSGYAKSANTPLVNLFGSVQSGQAALYLAGNGAEKFASDLEAMQNAAGATERAFDAFTKQGEDTDFLLKQIGVSSTVVAQNIGQQLLASVNPAIKAFADFAKGLAEADDSAVKMGLSVAQAGAALAGGLVAITGFAKGAAAAKSAAAALNLALAANPYVTAIAGAVALSVAASTLAKNFLSADAAVSRLNARLAAQNKQAKDAKAEAGKLAAELENLAKKESLSREEQLKQESVIKNLNKLYPELTAEVLRNAVAHGKLSDVLAAADNKKWGGQLSEYRRQIKNTEADIAFLTDFIEKHNGKVNQSWTNQLAAAQGKLAAFKKAHDELFASGFDLTVGQQDAGAGNSVEEAAKQGQAAMAGMAGEAKVYSRAVLDEIAKIVDEASLASSKYAVETYQDRKSAMDEALKSLKANAEMEQAFNMEREKAAKQLSEAIASKNKEEIKAAEERIDEINRLEKQSADLRKRYEEDVANTRAAKFRESVAEAQEYAGVVSDSFGRLSTVVSQYFTNQNAELENSLNKLEQEFEDKWAALDERNEEEQNRIDQEYADGILNLWEYLEAKEALEQEQADSEKQREKEQAELEKKLAQERNALAKKQFESEKASSIGNVIMSAAQAILGIWSTAPSLGPIAGPILAGVQTAAISALSATQIALIGQQQFVPAYASGTDYHPGGMALVGEEGAEIVNLPRGSSVMNNADTLELLEGAGGMVFYNTFNIEGSVNEADVAELARQVSYHLGAQIRARGG